MRITLESADDVLRAAEERAQRQKKTTGEMISELARRGLTASQESSSVKEPEAVYGLRPFPARGRVVTHELIDELFHDDAY
jgi:hypothetical protein